MIYEQKWSIGSQHSIAYIKSEMSPSLTIILVFYAEKGNCILLILNWSN